MMDTRAFLERVLPASGGDYFVGGVNGAGKYTQAPASTLDDVIAQIEQRKRQKQNIYFATGVYDGQRTIAGAKFKKALYLDLDTKGTHKGFTDKKGAVIALKDFCVATKFPFPNILVDSGHGIHAYWTFEEPVPVGDWQDLADALKQLCADHNLAVDESITADSARILRAPGTLNYKDPANPVPARILKFDVNDFDIASLRYALGVAPKAVPSQLVGTVGDDDLGANLYGERAYYAGNMIQSCGILKQSIDTGGKAQPGILWHKILHLLAFTEDGHDFVHAVSKDHEEYSAQRTERRFAYALEQKSRGIGPTLCKTLGQFFPSKCAACPFAGKINTPLVLGKAEESYLPPSYKMTDEGVFKAIGFNEARQAEDWQLVFPYRISNVELMTNGHDYFLQFTLSGGPIKKTLVAPVTLFAGEIKDLHSLLMTTQIYATDAQTKEFKQVMIPWMRKMTMVKDAVKTNVTGLGWAKVNGKVGFATATTIHLEDGSVQGTSGLDRQLLHDYSPKGDPAVWGQAAQSLIADKCNPIIAGVLSAFAAPLINFTGITGVMFSLCSPDSGTGKSSALRVAQSVWGNPLRGVNSLNDTALSVAKKMGFLNSLPAYWDELRMREEVQGLVKMIFQLGQGKERSRLTSATKQQEVGTWATMITVATNEPVLDHIDFVTGNTNAGRLRVFEVDVPPRAMSDSGLPFKLKELDQNHGYLADIYAEMLAKNHKQLRAAVEKMQLQVVKDLNATNDQRFWVAVVATLLLAAALVTKKGWLKIDIPAFKAWLYGEFCKQARAVTKSFKTADERAIAAFQQFCDEKRDSLIVCDHLTSRARKSPGAIHIQPMKSEIVGVIATKDQRIRVKKAAFTTWIYSTLKDSPRVVIENLVTAGAVETKASVTAGLANALDMRVLAIEVDLTHPNLAHLLEGS